MLRSSDLPCLPGYSVNYNVGQTRFHLSNHFQYIHKGTPYLADKELPGVGGVPLPGSNRSNYPSLYARGEVVELPPWLAFDKHVLRFDAFWVEGVPVANVNKKHIIHKCKVYFFLEDGTVKIVEPQERNSGIPQGCVVKRQRIRFPSRSDTNDYYDIIDFNIGKELFIFGKCFTLVNCDKFTRVFLNRLGIPVPDSMKMPEDPYVNERKQVEGIPSKAKPGKKDMINKFMQMDNRILSFKAYWDDRHNEHGYLHLLKVYYFLVNDTIEVIDVTNPEEHFTMVKRTKLPKVYKGIPKPGDNERVTVLNVIGGGPRRKTRSVLDPLGSDMESDEFYKDNDLVIGAIINAYGRRVVLYECDKFTQEYYRMKYGLDDFTPATRPLTREEQQVTTEQTMRTEIAPYNGFGTYEDSELNCISVHPQAIVKSYRQFYEKDKLGYDSRILRFHGQMISKDPVYNGRKFIISYFLADDTISVFEDVSPNSGTRGGTIISRRKIKKPGQNMYTNKPPDYYNYLDFFVGNVLNLESFEFRLVSADEYAFRYMEQHPNEFPKSNVRIILGNVRAAIKPKYKDFAAQFLSKDAKFLPVPFNLFRQAILREMGNHFTEHEVITLARYYANKVAPEVYSSSTIRRHAQDALKRELFEEFPTLREGFLHADPERNGHVHRNTAYCILRGAQVPLDVELIKLMLEKLGKGSDCRIYYDELIDFLNYQTHPVAPIQPVNISSNFSWQNLCRPPNYVDIDYVLTESFINDLQLETDLKQQCS